MTRRPLHGLIIQDIDTWVVTGTAPYSYEPVVIYEQKRSFIATERWTPFMEDQSNYAALSILAARIGVPWYVLYFQKGVRITDDSPVRVFEFLAVMPEYRWRDVHITALEFYRRWPYPFSRVAA